MRSYSERAGVRVITAVCVLLGITRSAWGQESGYTAFLATSPFMNESSFLQESSVELQGYEQKLLKQNPDIRSAWSAWQSRIKRVAAAQSLPDPQFLFGYFLEPVQTAVGPQRYRYGIRQTIPWPGKLIVSGDIQKQTAAVAFNRFRSRVESLLLKFRLLYFDAWNLDRVIETTRIHLSLLKNQEEVITVRYRSDAARHTDLIKTQIERIRLEDNLASLVAKRRSLQAEMRLLLNEETDTGIAITDTLAGVPDLPGRETVLKQVREHNPDILTAGSIVDQARRKTSLERLQAFPDFTLGMDIIETGPRLDGTGRPVSGSGTNPLLLSGSVSIPLWFRKNSSRLLSEKLNVSSSAKTVTAVINSKTAAAEKALNECDDSRRRITLYQDTLLPKSVESLRATEKAYAAGKADFISLIDALLLKLRIELEVAGSITSYYKARATLAALAGRRL